MTDCTSVNAYPFVASSESRHYTAVQAWSRVVLEPRLALLSARHAHSGKHVYHLGLLVAVQQLEGADFVDPRALI